MTKFKFETWHLIVAIALVFIFTEQVFLGSTLEQNTENYIQIFNEEGNVLISNQPETLSAGDVVVLDAEIYSEYVQIDMAPDYFVARKPIAVSCNMPEIEVSLFDTYAKALDKDDNVVAEGSSVVIREYRTGIMIDMPDDAVCDLPTIMSCDFVLQDISGKGTANITQTEYIFMDFPECTGMVDDSDEDVDKCPVYALPPDDLCYSGEEGYKKVNVFPAYYDADGCFVPERYDCVEKSITESKYFIPALILGALLIVIIILLASRKL